MAQLSKPAPGASESTALVMAIVLLTECLDQKGLVKFEDYRTRLREVWDQMPADDAGSGAGAVFEKLISVLNEVISKKHSPDKPI